MDRESTLFALACGHAGVVVLEANARFNDEDVENFWYCYVSFCLIILHATDASIRIFLISKQVSTSGSLDMSLSLLDKTLSQARCIGLWILIDCFCIAADLVNEIVTIASGEIPSTLLFIFLRMARLVRPMCILADQPFLHKLLQPMKGSLKAASWGALFLFIFVSMWSMVAVEVLRSLNRDIAQSGMYADCHWCANAFNSIAQACLTLMRHIVLGNDWGDVLVTIIEEHPWTVLFFFSAVASVNLGVLSFIVAAMVVGTQKALTGRDEILLDDAAHYEGSKRLLLKICSELDNDSTGITIERLVKGFESNAALRNFLRPIGVSREDLKCMFEVLDDGSGFVNRHLFVRSLLRMQAHCTDAFIMLTRFHMGKNQERLENQLIWMQEKEKIHKKRLSKLFASTGINDDLVVPKKSHHSLVTSGSGSIDRTTGRIPTPFASVTSVSTDSLKDLSPLAEKIATAAAERFGQLSAVSEKHSQELSQEAEPGSLSSRSASDEEFIAAASFRFLTELEKMRKHIDAKLDALEQHMARGEQSTVEGNASQAVVASTGFTRTPTPCEALSAPPIVPPASPLSTPPSVTASSGLLQEPQRQKRPQSHLASVAEGTEETDPGVEVGRSCLMPLPCGRLSRDGCCGDRYVDSSNDRAGRHVPGFRSAADVSFKQPEFGVFTKPEGGSGSSTRTGSPRSRSAPSSTLTTASGSLSNSRGTTERSKRAASKI